MWLNITLGITVCLLIIFIGLFAYTYITAAKPIMEKYKLGFNDLGNDVRKMMDCDYSNCVPPDKCISICNQSINEYTKELNIQLAELGYDLSL
jgi:hypothetical protein